MVAVEMLIVFRILGYLVYYRYAVLSALVLKMSCNRFLSGRSYLSLASYINFAIQSVQYYHRQPAMSNISPMADDILG